MKRDDPYYNKFFQVWVDYKFEKEIFTYDNKQLIFYKNIQRIYDDEKKINNICQINENELIFYARQKGKIYGENDILIFYDMKTDNIISKLTVGKGENDYYSIKLINMDILIISGEETIIFVDIKNRKIINEVKFDIYIPGIVCLNEKSFLYYQGRKIGLLSQYEIEDLKTFRLKEEKKIELEVDNFLIYPGNRIIIYFYKIKKLSIYG